MSEIENIKDNDKNDKLPTGNESERAASDQAATTQPQTQPPHMEVHKHPHDVTHKKKWGEYFLEFLLIFLAVFLGFVAENVREHQVEEKRAREYIRSFYEDLKYDIGAMDWIIKTETVKISALKKMRDCYDSIKQSWTSTSCLTALIKYSRSNNNFHLTNRTLNQLGNAGGFRLLKPRDADSIVGYQNDATDLRDFESTLYQPAQDNIRNTSMDLMEFSANTELYSDITVDPTPFNSNVTKPLLLSDNKELLNKYFNQLLQYLRAIVRHRLLLMALKDHAGSIAEYFNHNYHLE